MRWKVEKYEKEKMKPSADVVLTYGIPYGCISLLLDFIRSLSSEGNSSPLPHCDQEID